MRRALLLGVCLFCPLFGAQKRGVNPGPGWSLDLRYRAPRGLGYQEGYGSAQLFLSSTSMERFHPFIDLRGHLFNDGKWAANGGLGFRYIADSRTSTYGGNLYYDFRDGGSIGGVHQMSGGLEYLSRFFEMRTSGYLPLGSRTSRSDPTFCRFSGHNVLLSQNVAAALSHVDGEIGVPLHRLGPISLFFGAGGYYLFHKSVEGAELGGVWGKKARAEIGFYDGVILGGAVTSDPIFEVRSQGYLTVSIPLGPKNLRQGGKRFRSRYPGNFDAKAIQFARLTQNVERDEIIPIQEKGQEVCLLPCNGTCQAFFVDNRAEPGDGTFEEPFATLKEAEEASSPGDLLYILPGNGTPDGMDQGIVLKEGQLLIGSGSSFSLCGQCIPACSRGASPVITNISGGSAITLAEGVEVAGIEIEGPVPIGVDTFSSGTFFLHDLFLHDLEGGIGIGSLGTSPSGSKLFSNISIGASDGDAIGISLRSAGGAISLREVAMQDIGGTQAQIAFEGPGILTIENCIFGRQIVADTSIATSFTWDESCFVFHDTTITSQDIGLSVDFSATSGAQFQATCNQIVSGMQGIFVEGVGKENMLLFDANQIGGSGRSIQIETSLESDATKICVTGNEGSGAFWLDVAGVSSTPVCLNLRGNSMSGYNLINALGSLDVESEDGTVGGVEALNKGGIVTAPDVGFVGIGACACD